MPASVHAYRPSSSSPRGTKVVPRIGILPPMVAALPTATFEPAFGASCAIMLTRARQGMVIFVPPGAKRDKTRSPGFYEGVSQYLTDLGVPQV